MSDHSSTSLTPNGGRVRLTDAQIRALAQAQLDAERVLENGDVEPDASPDMRQIIVQPGQNSSDADDALSPIDVPMPTRTPLLYYCVMAASLIAISCAGTLLRKLDPTPPFLKAFWRLFFISWYLMIGFIVQWRQSEQEIRTRFLTRNTLLILFATGLITSVHFASWIWSLQHTSLAHSLFFVCAHPLLIVMVMLAQGVVVNKWEAAGVLVGLGGSALMLADDAVGSGADDPTAIHDKGGVPVTWQGDLVAFIGAFAMVGYLYSGKHCRTWLPLFLYAFPVTLTAAFPLLFLSCASEDITFSGTEQNSVFGFLGAGAIGTMLLIVIGPGITGHLGINFVLSHIPPLAVSIVITVEPILGVLIGIAFGVEVAPHLYTILGGPLTLIGCLLAVWGTYLREKASLPSSDVSSPSGSTDRASGRHQRLAQSAPGEVELHDMEWADDADVAELSFEMDYDHSGQTKHAFASSANGGKSSNLHSSTNKKKGKKALPADESKLLSPDDDADQPRSDGAAVDDEENTDAAQKRRADELRGQEALEQMEREMAAEMDDMDELDM
jgi:drug/metabolite transporter (DMT)-like permease